MTKADREKAHEAQQHERLVRRAKGERAVRLRDQQRAKAEAKRERLQREHGGGG